MCVLAQVPLGEHGRPQHVELVSFERAHLCLVEVQLLRDFEHTDLVLSPRLRKAFAPERSFGLFLRRVFLRLFVPLFAHI